MPGPGTGRPAPPLGERPRCHRGLPPAQRCSGTCTGPLWCMAGRARLRGPPLRSYLQAWSSRNLGGRPRSVGFVASGPKSAPG
eukprot:9322510-Lingulodinium_polyedra.AAC.1